MQFYINIKKFAQLIGAVMATLAVASPAMASFDGDLGLNPIVTLRLVNNQAVNLNKQFNGGFINSWDHNPNDGDQQLVFDSIGNNCGYYRRSGTNLVLSLKNAKSGSELEAWNKVQGAWQQIFCNVPASKPGYYNIVNQRFSNLGFNIPYSKKNVKILAWNITPGDQDQMFLPTVVGRGPATVVPVQPQTGIRGQLLTGNCKSWTQGCLPEGYDGYNNTWGFGAFGNPNDGTWHNCTAFAAWWLNKNGQSTPNINLGNANTWGVNAQRMGWDVRSQAVVGSVGVREVGTYGHVFVVSAVNVDGTMWIMEDNFDWNRGWSSRRKVSTSYGQKFIVPPAFR
jgi:surface antigen